MTPDDSDTTEIFGIATSVCEQCTKPFVNKSGEREYCNECNNENVTPNTELRALIQEWREGVTAEKVCADELEELIDGENDE